VAENQESLGALARDLNVVRNKQIEIFDRLQTLEERLQDLLNRFRSLEDRVLRVEKTASSGSPGYGR
jgi:hypothetical protein